MKDPVKLLIILVAAVAVGLTIVFFVPERPKKLNETPEPESQSSTSETRKAHNAKNSETELEAAEEPASEGERTQSFEVDAIAVPVVGNPLVVTLRDFPELGQISIEEWSDEIGAFTGKPVKSGTKLTLMNPNKRGQRIRIIAP